VARSLGRRGIPVWVINQGGHLVASASRYVSRRLPWPAADDRSRLKYLLTLCATHHLYGWTLIPTDDYTVGLVSANHETLANKYRLTVPPWEKLRWACDNVCCISWRRNFRFINRGRCALPIATISPELIALSLSFSNPLFACNRAVSLFLKPGSPRIANRFWARFDEASVSLSPENLIIQEVVPGGGESQFSYAALCRDGRSLASLVARRTRQFPRDFGQLSTYVETVEAPEVVEPAERLLAEIRFTGLAEVEFKRDPRNGTLKVLDINPRVWGWHTLSKRAGVDFPYLLWLLMMGEPVPRLRGRAGARWVHWTADLRLAIEEVLTGRLSLRNYLRSVRGPLESAIFAWDDPLPGLFDLPLFAWTACKRLVGG